MRDETAARSMTRIHPTAVVDSSAVLDLDVVVEAFALVGPDAEIGAGCTIGPRATILGATSLGPGCHVGVGAVLGGEPQAREYRGEPTMLRIGADTRIGEYTTVSRGTAASGATVIGDRCTLMSYVHVGHDCRIENDVVLVNAVQLGGHVGIDDFAQVGGSTPVHQYVRIGTHAFVGGGSRVPQDVPPYALCAGNPVRQYGVNIEGLRRAGFTSETRLAIKRAYRLLFNSSRPRHQVRDLLREAETSVPEVRVLLEFLETSGRGVSV